MKVSLSWLKEYVRVDMDVHDLADALTMAGLEVEAVSDRFDYLKGVVVGRIVEIGPHPDEEKLKLCIVDIGGDTIPVVCGAPNAAKGVLAPCAMPGTCLPDGTVLEKRVVQGQVSAGMLCSEAELGLGNERDRIMELDPDTPVGALLNQVLGLSDAVLEIDLTPNRPDCLSIMGVAREVAAIEKAIGIARGRDTHLGGIFYAFADRAIEADDFAEQCFRVFSIAAELVCIRRKGSEQTKKLRSVTGIEEDSHG